MQFPIHQDFKLSEMFISKYVNRKPPFGFDGLGEFVFLRTYSRILENGKNEQWYETVRRVVEGIYNIQKAHIEEYNLGWNQMKAQKSAQEMYDRIFNFKMLPAGRSLWAMGSPVIMERGLAEALYNCSYLSTETMKEDPGKVFANAMDFLMCGVGVGADVLGANKVFVKGVNSKEIPFVIEDSREGWVDSLHTLINNYVQGKERPIFDYSLVREAGEPIRTFGGVSSGPGPLAELHEKVEIILINRVGHYLNSRDIVDIFNLVGKAVVAGNVRRSAEILLGNPDEEFLDLKDYEKNPERVEYGWASNNSVYSKVGDDYSDISSRIANNGEPGIFWLENAQQYGRMRENERNNKDFRVRGLNPCVTGDTKIATVYEGNKSFKELADRGTDVLVYTWNPNTKLPEISTMRNPRLTRKNQKVLEVTFDSGLQVKCTPDHNFYTFRGYKVQAKDLIIGQSIRAFSASLHKDGHIRIHGWRDGKARHQYLSRMIWEYFNGEIEPGFILHHKDLNKLNNAMTNFQLVTPSEHNSLHYDERVRKGFYHRNHKVVSVQELDELQDVYNGTVDNTHAYIITDEVPVGGFLSGIVSANCGEITLESGEMCNLVELFPTKHESLEDFNMTIKFAYLYAKSITLLSTHWTDTNRVMLRNRRIGLSMTGIAQFISEKGFEELGKWMEEGYRTAEYYDTVYSEWFAIPRSIKLTTIKPSGTISLLAGVTPGIHFPESNYYIRRVRLAKNSQFIPALEVAGFNIEPAVGQENSTVVVEFPICVGENVRTLKEVSMWEQLALAAFAQRNWADNSVSVTVTFDPEKESKDVINALNIYQFQLKAVSFLPRISYGAYPQMPYEEITKEKYEEIISKLSPLDFSSIFSLESVGDKYCNNDTCLI